MDSKSNQLKKKLGLSFGIAILIGGTIGVGILRTPGAIAGMLANYWAIIFCWVLGGVYILIGINTYAELATMLPKAGGSYNYIKRAFGDYAGFLSGWFDYILNAIPPAFYCIVIGEYYNSDWFFNLFCSTAKQRCEKRKSHSTNNKCH
jgi:APA family basic amino acid/polyamine antiporter